LVTTHEAVTGFVAVVGVGDCERSPIVAFDNAERVLVQDAAIALEFEADG